MFKTFETEICVNGMHCNHCAMRVKDALTKIKGVKKVDVNLETGMVRITSKIALIPAQLSPVISNLGYTIK